MPIAPRVVSILALCVILIGLGVFVFWRDSKARVNRLFALTVCAIAGWIASVSFALSTRDLEATVILGRVAFAFASAIPFSFLWMFEAFRDPRFARGRLRVVIPGLFCLMFVVLALSPWIVAGAQFGALRPNFIYGSVHPFFGVYFLFSWAFALYSLAQQLRDASGIKKLQLRYLLLGIILGGTGPITTNLLIPLIWKTSEYSTLGPYFSLAFAAFSAHAIIRYRLMDIKVIIRQGVIYVSAIAVAASIFIAIAMLFRMAAGFESHTLPISFALS